MMNKKVWLSMAGVDNPIDDLFDSYFDNRGCDNERVEEAYERFCHTLADVDPFRIEEIMGAAAELCLEHERTGFAGGVRTGMRLMIEVNVQT